jgi:hypothetical protein
LPLPRVWSRLPLPRKMMTMNRSKSYRSSNPYNQGWRTSRRCGSGSAQGVRPTGTLAPMINAREASRISPEIGSKVWPPPPHHLRAAPSTITTADCRHDSSATITTAARKHHTTTTAKPRRVAYPPPIHSSSEP